MTMSVATATLRFKLIDDFSVIDDGHEVNISSGPARQALCYLALSPGKTESRSKLAAMIWENSSEQHARRNLRQLLYTVRSDLGERGHGLKSDRSSVMLQANSFTSDFEEILKTLRSGQVPDAVLVVQQIHERLLSSIPGQGELFASWLQLKRREFENTIRNILEEIMAGDDLTQAERAARASLNLDASDENAARFLIRHYHDRGDTGRALGVYSDLWDHLDEEYDMEPSAPTQELIAAVKSGATADRTDDSSKQAEPGRKFRIGVLPTVASDGPEDAGKIGDLFRTELISRLARFREIDVVDAAVRMTQTDYELKLAIAPSRDQLALTATLTRTSDGVVIWSNRFSGMTENWREQQIELAAGLAAACSLHLSRARLSEIRALPTVRGALDNWLLGQKLLHNFQKEDWDAAPECFRKAIEHDPNFSMAYSSLSQAHNIRHLTHPGIHRDQSLLVESKQFANRAIALDPTDSRAHLCRAWASLLLSEYAQAEAGFAIARQCNEDDPWTVISSALGAAFCGDLELANELASRFHNQGWTTTPTEWGYHSCIRFMSADDEGCIAAAANADNGIYNMPAWKAAALWHMGEHASAAEAWGEFETVIREHWDGAREATTAACLDWFLSCFPIRDAGIGKRLAEGVFGAAGAYRH